MPANLTPEYRKAEQEYREATTPDARLAALQKMLSVIPKHKGTDRMQGDLKHRISRLKNSIEGQRRKRGPSFRVKPEGAGQIMLIGPPNTGKSSLLAALTRAKPDIAEYPCTTREPLPGMLQFEKVQIQLVDLPPVWEEHCESFVFDNIRGADGAVILVDLAAPDPAEQARSTLNILSEKHVYVVPARLDEPVPPGPHDELETLLVFNKSDRDPGGEILGLVRQMLDTPLPVRVISVEKQTGLDDLAADLFRLLHVIRIFSKQPGKKPDLSAPYTIPVGSTVLDLAAHVHKDFAANFKSARVWGSARFDGQVVQRDHVLQDRDIAELTMR